MRNKQVILLLILIFGLSQTSLLAQENINTSGGKAISGQGAITYSVGQLVYQTSTGSNGSVAEGVQQSFEISIATEIHGFNDISLSMIAYPNPSTDYLTLNIYEFETSNFSYQMYDIKGELLQNGNISQKETNITMSKYDPALYFLKVLKGNKEVKTFKIIKN